MCGMVVTIEYGNYVLCKIYVCVFCEFVYYSIIMYTHVYALCNYPFVCQFAVLYAHLLTLPGITGGGRVASRPSNSQASH